MSEVAVVIPSWSADRTEALVWDLKKLATREGTGYLVVGTHTYTAPSIVPAQPLSPVEAMAIGAERILGANSGFTVLAFLHDDVTLSEQVRGWDTTLLSHFYTHPRCGLAGFGGAIGFGHADIYKTVYDHRQLARFDFVSNMRDAESHGRRVTEAVRVAALDGFSMVMSREFYERSGGWAACERDGLHHHMMDAWVSCRSRELGYETWVVPLAVHHEGGGTSVTRNAEYERVCERLGYRDQQELYYRAHRTVYDRFHRVIPFDVRGELPT